MSYDLVTERAVLGAVMAAEGAAEPFRALTPDDWYLPAHKAIAAVVASMLSAGTRVTAETVLVEAQTRGLVPHRIDPVVLFGCHQAAAIPAALPTLVERIRSLATARTLAGVGTRLSQRMESAWTTGVDPADIDAAIAEVRRACDDAEKRGAALDAAPPMGMAEFLAVEDTRSWIIPGLLERMERIVLTGAEGGGKALAVDTPVPTPAGWTTMGELAVGDEVFHADGQPVRVIAATETMHGRPCYRVTFSDGAEIVADENHLWLTDTLASREAAAKARRRGPLKPRGTDQRHKRKHFAGVRTTAEVAATLKARGGHAVNHSIAVAQPLQYAERDLPIHPYVLGAWLGDGTSRGAGFTSADPEIVEEIRRCGESVTHYGGIAYRVSDGDRSRAKPETFQGRLRALGVLQNKHIPAAYLQASVAQRMDLLQGLMDTDGSVFGRPGIGRGTGTKCEFSVVSKPLAEGVLELALGLGIKATMREGAARLDGREVGRRYRIQFRTDLPVFRLPRKLGRIEPIRTERPRMRYITSVERIDSVPVRCIQVDRADGLFIAGRECIVTHNSVLCSQLAATMAGGVHPFTAEPLGGGHHGIRVLVVDCENSPAQSRRRFKWIVGQVDAARKKHGLTPVDWSDHMWIEMRPAGIDMLDPRDVAWLDRAISSVGPDLLVLGPLYKLHHADMNKEEPARELVWQLDLLRERHGFALLTEAHAGNAEDRSGNRQMRPVGSSVFRRWSEFGFGLVRARTDPGHARAEIVDVISWRGSREERAWPTQLQHGTTLPWMPADPAYYDQLPRSA